jgi:S-adenosylmethionine:tRNA ribosyltransferase-isomerase
MIAIDRLLDFTLPTELEATRPPESRGLRRDEVRLLVSQASTGRPYMQGDDSIRHARFTDLPDLLQAGDLVVANDSATLPAALTARRVGDSEADSAAESFALHLSTWLGRRNWVVEPRKVAVAADEELALPGGGIARLLAPYQASQRLWIARLYLPLPVLDYLRRWGRPITYSYVQGEWPLAMYQNVYTRPARGNLGSAEMPSAGRPFSHAVLERLHERGIGFATLTLHTGVSSLEAHELPYPERFAVPARTAAAVNAARADGARVIAVGTTVIRALESAADERGRVRPTRAWTDLVVTPERGVHAVDGLLTGFHEPRATHLAMLEALAGRAHLELVYRAALAEGYLWHEFGDVHLLLR